MDEITIKRGLLAEKTTTRIAVVLLTLFIISLIEYQFYNNENKKITGSRKDVSSGNGKYLLLYDKIILKISKRHNVDPDLVKAVIMAESLVDTNAVSKKRRQRPYANYA